MAGNLPDFGFWTAFNCDPNDPSRVPIWTDLRTMVTRVEGLARGRQYELGQSQASAPQVTYRDPSEHLNPANTSSPYSPNVVPYRESLALAHIPDAGTGNLINSKMWTPNDLAADPSFESYANGAAMPSWMASVSTVPTVTTTNPQQGTKSLTYDTLAQSYPQGIRLADWVCPCMPGRQYTTSVWVRQTVASTQRLTVDGLLSALDSFGRTASNGWGTTSSPDIGGTWSNSGGSASDFSVGSGTGKHSIGTLNVRRFTTLATSNPDADVYATISVPAAVTPAGNGSAAVLAGVVARYTDADNHYRAEAEFNGLGDVNVSIHKRVAAVTTSLAAAFNDTYTGAATFRLRFQVYANVLRAKLWPATMDEPIDWSVSTNDNAITTATGSVGCTTAATTAVTNTLPYVVTFDDFRCVGSAASSTTTTAGAYVRLSVTFTAHQPRHVATLATVGAALAGTVNVDAIQHQPGTLSDFQTTGPNIMPYYRNYAERWPRRYTSAGFEGWADVPAVDAFAALQAIGLNAEYVTAVLAKRPDFFWPLQDGSSSITAAEQSGNNGPPLEWAISPQGASTAPQFGSALDLVGNPAGVGVRWTPPTGTGSDPLSAGTGLAAGTLASDLTSRWSLFPSGSYPVAVWEASVAVWVSVGLQPTFDTNILRMIAFQADDANYREIFRLVYLVAGTPYLYTGSKTVGLAASGAAVIADNRPHLLVATIQQADGGNTEVALYVDGVLAASNTATTAAIGGVYPKMADTICIGSGPWSGNLFAGTASGTISLPAVWTRKLNAGDVADLWDAGGEGFAGELTGTRLARHLDLGRYVGPRRISAGTSAMQPPSWAGAIDLLSDSQATTMVDDGTLWVAADGYLIFEGRQQRWLRLTPSGVFGEDTANGEIPYLEGIEFDFDPTFTFADVRVSRIDGVTARGGLIADVVATARKYFPRTNPADSGDYATDVLAQAKADWVFNTHKVPLQRISVITLNLGANPAIQAAAMRIEVGQRWTVKRRAKAANAGAGITMSADYFIEKVGFPVLSLETGEWTMQLFLSPIGAAPGGTLQPWILGDSVYSVLGSTTILGW